MLWYQDPRRGRLVISRDTVAARLGVRVGMSVAEAGEMASRGPLTPHIEPHDPRGDKLALSEIAALLLEEISPLVAIESLDKAKWAGQDLHQPQSILCDVSGVAHLFGGELGLIDEIAKLLAGVGFTAKIAIANSIAAAWALAHYHDGPVIVGDDHDASLERLRALPVEALRIMPDTAATLVRLGIFHLDALLRLPRGGLATRLGKPLVDRIAQILGEADEPMAVLRPPAEFTSDHELDYASDDLNILADRIRRLVSNVKGGLATSGRGALRLTCRLDLSAHPPLAVDSGQLESESRRPAPCMMLEVNLFAPTQDENHLSGLLVSALENKSLTSTVIRLSLAVTLTSPIRTSQGTLFADPIGGSQSNDWTHQKSSARLIDSLSERLGRERVLGITPSHDPLPEKSFRASILTGKAKFASPRKRLLRAAPSDEIRRVESNTKPALLIKKNQRRPFCLLSQPISIAVPQTNDASVHEPPRTFRVHNRLHTVLGYWGPERIETGWWYGPCIRRDYYRVETEAGWWWIYRDLTHQTWMLHGRFS